MLNPKAPGCWGFASANNPENEFCQKCVWFISCSHQAKSHLIEIHKHMNVADMLSRYDVELKPKCENTIERKSKGRKRVKTKDLTPLQLHLISEMPQKSGKVLEQLFKKGIDLGLELRSNINPFEEHRPKFLKTPCRLLIGGGMTAQTLRIGFMKDFPHWSEATIQSHINIVLTTFKALDILECHQGYYRIKQ